MAEQDSRKPVPAYVSYKSFRRFIKSLQDTHIPTRIDRSFLTGMSGSAQSALQQALIFLGLMDGDEKPMPALEELVASSGEDFAARLRVLILRAYPFLVSGIDLKRTTSGEVHEIFRKQNVSGSTAAKAIAFFLGAAKDAGIEVSKHVRPPSIVRSTGTKRSAQRSSDSDDADGDDEHSGGGGGGYAPDVHPALAGILMQLPAPGQPFTTKDRKRFLAAFEAVLSLVYPGDDDE